MRIPESELILNPDGSVYHLNLVPGEIANTIITVGDPDRVDQVSRYFDVIHVDKHHREFRTHTGELNGKLLTVISTGIGTGNIDIVLNELDALVNIDFETRSIKNEKISLDIIRVGTSGGLQPEVAVDSYIMSELAIGFDNLLHFYGNTDRVFDMHLSKAFQEHMAWNKNNSAPYFVHANEKLLNKFSSEEIKRGITTTNIGFYGPQGRVLRIPLEDQQMNDKITSFKADDKKITNLEMETAALYGMSRLLGHSALSLNAILANRANGSFSENPTETVDKLIKKTLNILTA